MALLVRERFGVVVRFVSTKISHFLMSMCSISYSYSYHGESLNVLISDLKYDYVQSPDCTHNRHFFSFPVPIWKKSPKCIREAQEYHHLIMYFHSRVLADRQNSQTHCTHTVEWKYVCRKEYFGNAKKCEIVGEKKGEIRILCISNNTGTRFTYIHQCIRKKMKPK